MGTELADELAAPHDRHEGLGDVELGGAFDLIRPEPPRLRPPGNVHDEGPTALGRWSIARIAAITDLIRPSIID